MNYKITLKDVLLFVMVVAIFCVCNIYEHHYTRQGTVVATDGDEVIVDDTTENEWSFYDDEYSVGDNVKMIMFDNCTAFDITDDEITKVIKID